MATTIGAAAAAAAVVRKKSPEVLRTYWAELLPSGPQVVGRRRRRQWLFGVVGLQFGRREEEEEEEEIGGNI